MSSCLRSLLPVAAAILVAALLTPTCAQAAGNVTAILSQAPDAPAAPLSRNYAFDIALVLVLFGGALFAVCKSSRRS